MEVVPKAALYARPRPSLAPGSPGTLAHAIASADKRRKWTRAVSEGVIPRAYADGWCPRGMANIDDRFCIDRWEGTLEAIAEDGTATPWPQMITLDTTKRYRATSAPGVFPQAYISGEQAEAACNAAQKRLCSAAEWRFACGGSQGTVYPYGPKYVADRCNDHGRSPMPVFYPQVQKSWGLVSNTDMNDPRLNAMEGTLAKTGAHSACVNDWGVYDMVGNVHEWVADRNGTFQGGYYLDTRENGEGCAYRTTAHGFDYHDYSTGFRCCADRIARRDDDPELDDADDGASD
jgi:formylglycine-generating enzyme